MKSVSPLMILSRTIYLYNVVSRIARGAPEGLTGAVSVAFFQRRASRDVALSLGARLTRADRHSRRSVRPVQLSGSHLYDFSLSVRRLCDAPSPSVQLSRDGRPK